MLRKLVILALFLADLAAEAQSGDTVAVAASVGVSNDPTLVIEPSDLAINQSLEGGYDVWVRAKPGLSSVLLTESSADPAKRENSYALRDPASHATGGGERRLLDGKLLDEGKGPFSIVDSTPEPNRELGVAFHVFLPYVVVYGYPWSRMGEIQILDGTFINIRAFRKPQADYTGPFHDNPFRLAITQKVSYTPPVASVEPLPERPPDAPPPAPSYMPDAVKALEAIAREGKGTAERSTGEDDLGRKIGKLLDESVGESLDLVLALDTTNSMRDDMLYLRGSIVGILREHISRFPRYRVGLLYYKDYNDDYLVKVNPFVSDLDAIQRQIDTVQVGGGRDIPEAVYEALYHSIHRYEWSADARVVLLIGDAPPHQIPLGKITKEMVYRDAELRNIRIDTIILPP